MLKIVTDTLLYEFRVKSEDYIQNYSNIFVTY